MNVSRTRAALQAHWGATITSTDTSAFAVLDTLAPAVRWVQSAAGTLCLAVWTSFKGTWAQSSIVYGSYSHC